MYLFFIEIDFVYIFKLDLAESNLSFIDDCFMILSFFLDEDLPFIFEFYLPPSDKQEAVLSLKSLSLFLTLL